MVTAKLGGVKLNLCEPELLEHPSTRPHVFVDIMSVDRPWRGPLA